MGCFEVFFEMRESKLVISPTSASCTVSAVKELLAIMCVISSGLFFVFSTQAVRPFEKKTKYTL